MTGRKADNLPWPAIPNKRFQVASIDCPWHFITRSAPSDPKADRTPQRHYPTADLAHLKTIPMQDILDDNAWLAVWMTGPLVAKGVHCILADSWGLEMSGLGFTWLKLWNNFDTGLLARTPLLEKDLAFGGGYTTRKNTEQVYFMKKGSPKVARKDIFEVIVSPRREHSRKPEEFYRRMEHYAHGDRIDMFGGRAREGWTHWGYGHREGEAPAYESAPGAEIA